jgi:hypothetical protein
MKTGSAIVLPQAKRQEHSPSEATRAPVSTTRESGTALKQRLGAASSVIQPRAGVFAAVAGLQTLAGLADARGSGGGSGGRSGGGFGGRTSGTSSGSGANGSGSDARCCNKSPATTTTAALTTGVALTAIAKQAEQQFANAIAGPQSTAIQALVAPTAEVAHSAVAASADSLGATTAVTATAVVAVGAAAVAIGYGVKMAYNSLVGTTHQKVAVPDELTEVKTTG